MGLSDGNWTGAARSDRRSALRLAAGAALLPFLAQGQTAFAQAILTGGQTPESAIAPPAGTMVYRRTLERALPGGFMFRVSRDFAVRFEQAEAGFLVTGTQVRASVDAPANLADLARLEQQRVEAGIFPLVLDRLGGIVDGQESAPDSEVARVLTDIRARFGNDDAEAGALIAAVHQAGTLLTARMPQDLFAPQEGTREAREEIALPWGDRGEVVTIFAAARDPLTRLMRSARRVVVTRMGADERRSSELWELF